MRNAIVVCLLILSGFCATAQQAGPTRSGVVRIPGPTSLSVVTGSDLATQLTSADQLIYKSVTGLQSFSQLAAYTQPTASYDGSTWVKTAGTTTTTTPGYGALVTASSGGYYYARQFTGPLDPRYFGAKADGVTNDRVAIAKFLTYPTESAQFRGGVTYVVSGMSTLTGVTGKTIYLNGANLINSDTTQATFLFQNCQDIAIDGGSAGQSQAVHGNGGNSQHIFQFDQCQRVLINRIHINYSPEMGIAITNCNFVTVQNSIVEHCFRDGIYCRNSANIRILNTDISNVKDDAASFHGKDTQASAVAYSAADKAVLNSYGYTQPTNFLVQGCTVTNCYNGLVSISGKNVSYINNTITNVVLSGVAIYNITSGDAEVATNGEISGNTIINAGASTTINSQNFTNNGQSSLGRAAIFIGSTGTNNQIGQGETKRSVQMRVMNNRVLGSGANSLSLRDTDKLTLKNNYFENAVVSATAGVPVEIYNLTGLDATGNTVIDTRTTPQHVYGYQINQTSGYSDTWNVSGYTTGESQILNSTLATNAARQLIPKAETQIVTTGNIDFNTYTTPRYSQTTGGSQGTAANNPYTLAGGYIGYFEVTVSLNNIKQTYTDFSTGNQVYRVQNGTWGAWQKLTSNLNTGIVGQSGNGSSTGFAFAHGFAATPSYITVQAASPDADQSNIKYITADASSIVVYYKVAPPSGTNNLIWYWSAKK